MIIQQLNNELFYIEHLTPTEDLSNFRCLKAYGLENYLKNYAVGDENVGAARTYLIKSCDTKEIVAYFTLRCGLITVSRGFWKGFDASTGIELANFATNDSYREGYDQIPKLGSYVFLNFILPLAREIRKYVGAEFLYIYSLPEHKLMEHYSTMGFNRADIRMERFVYRHVKPYYDKHCIFMFQKLD